MKLSLIALVLFVLAVLSCNGQVHNYGARWDYNTEEDIYGYRLYALELADTLLTPLEYDGDSYAAEGYLIGFYNHDSLKAISPDSAVVRFPSLENGKWLHAGICAVDTAGNRSNLNVSNFLRKEDKVHPAIPAGFGIFR